MSVDEGVFLPPSRPRAPPRVSTPPRVPMQAPSPWRVYRGCRSRRLCLQCGVQYRRASGQSVLLKSDRWCVVTYNFWRGRRTRTKTVWTLFEVTQIPARRHSPWSRWHGGRCRPDSPSTRCPSATTRSGRSSSKTSGRSRNCACPSSHGTPSLTTHNVPELSKRWTRLHARAYASSPPSPQPLD